MKQIASLLVACCLLVSAGVFAADAKKADDKKPKPVNVNCPVTGEKVDPAVTTQYKGKTIGFCCADCPKDFNKDPAKYMKKVDEDVAKQKKDAKKGEQPAADSTKVVNKMCPVEKDNAVDPTAPTTSYKGKTVGFCCDDCIKKFERDPDAFAANMK